jgi:hypothetical protein
LYSGWDTAAYVGEEARGKQAGPAAITSVVLLFVMYSVVILAFQGIAPGSKIQANAGNVLAYVGRLIGGGFWADVMIVAVLGGTLASLQAAIVSASRIDYAMGRDRVFPAWFGRTHDRHQTPWNATIAFGLMNVVFLWAATLIGSIGTALSDIVSTLGLIAAMFYLLTAGTAVLYSRKSFTTSASNLVLGGVLPGLGRRSWATIGASHESSTVPGSLASGSPMASSDRAPIVAPVSLATVQTAPVTQLLWPARGSGRWRPEWLDVTADAQIDYGFTELAALSGDRVRSEFRMPHEVEELAPAVVLPGWSLRLLSGESSSGVESSPS